MPNKRASKSLNASETLAIRVEAGKTALAAESEDVTSPADTGIQTVAELHARTEQRLGPHQRFVEQVTALIGRPLTIYIIIVFIIGWCVWNLLAPHPYDPAPFFVLQGMMSTTALVVSVMVLTTQNRQGRRAHQHANLDLQINLLSERKLAKIIQLIEELRLDLPMVQNRVDPVARAMQETVDAHAVASALEESIEPAKIQKP